MLRRGDIKTRALQDQASSLGEANYNTSNVLLQNGY
jgi:hypothetical protein